MFVFVVVRVMSVCVCCLGVWVVCRLHVYILLGFTYN